MKLKVTVVVVGPRGKTLALVVASYCRNPVYWG